MQNLVIPKDYRPLLTERQTQKAIKFIKDTFQKKIACALNLDRVTAPLFVTKKSGINDDLNGVERKVTFTIKEIGGEDAEVVQSLAKWKRAALYKYGYKVGEGIYTDMNAIRRDDDVDNMHSVFVDQWDWERIISREQRNTDFLKETVRKIVGAIADTKADFDKNFSEMQFGVCRDVYFVTAQELEDRYPDMTAKERENAVTEQYKTVFVMQIGGKLKSGKKHDGRAPDYDDWNLNGDILVWNEVLGCAFELSSMGIRVDEKSLPEQLKICGAETREKYEYDKNILDGVYPLTIGGGIGQSRLCMYFLKKAHIGEVHVSVWPEEMVKRCGENNIFLL
jgi:aspartate--ammonia ligase